MYPSLSGIDGVEVRRQELLAEAALRHRYIDSTETGKIQVGPEPRREGKTVMWTLVNASYGIAMGQRPTGATHTDWERGSKIDATIQKPSLQPKVILLRCAHYGRRALATLTTGVGKRRALSAINN